MNFIWQTIVGLTNGNASFPQQSALGPNGSGQPPEVPRATDIPDFVLGSTETPSPSNPLGVKGVGEAGTIGATPAIANAVIDALSPFGIRHLDLPFTPERVWRAIQDKGGRS